MADTDLTGANALDQKEKTKKLVIRVVIIVAAALVTLWVWKKFVR
jgi:hypothetical protein